MRGPKGSRRWQCCPCPPRAWIPARGDHQQRCRSISRGRAAGGPHRGTVGVPDADEPLSNASGLAVPGGSIALDACDQAVGGTCGDQECPDGVQLPGSLVLVNSEHQQASMLPCFGGCSKRDEPMLQEAAPPQQQQAPTCLCADATLEACLQFPLWTGASCNKTCHTLGLGSVQLANEPPSSLLL